MIHSASLPNLFLFASGLLLLYPISPNPMTTLLRAPGVLLPFSPLSLSSSSSSSSSLENSRKSISVNFFSIRPQRLSQYTKPSYPLKTTTPNFRFSTFTAFAAEAEQAEVTTAAPEKENSDDEVTVDNGPSDSDIVDTEERASSVIMETLQSYKEALANEDQQTIAEIESFLQSIEDEKSALAAKVATTSGVLLSERERLLRISADFDNFRKRTERERLSLMTNAKGEVVESLLPVLDNFERAKAQIKVETEGEEKINNSYQSIYKQFVEVLTSLGVEAVETVGIAFDPLLHEAIMREDSMEYEEGIIIQEFRKGFKLGERLLRPTMVKVSAGPGPVKPEDDMTLVPTNEETEEVSVDEGDD